MPWPTTVVIVVMMVHELSLSDGTRKPIQDKSKTRTVGWGLFWVVVVVVVVK